MASVGSRFPRPFGKYYLEKSLSRGGMGEVFLAMPKEMQARCVVKTIRSDLTGDKEFVGRFADEAKIMTRTVHENIIRIFDCGKVGSDYYIAMEYVYGRDLGDVLDRAYERGQPMPRELGLHICKALLSGLDYIHNATTQDGQPMNLVHRDISPQNVILGFDGKIKLIDFGLARTELLPGRTQGALAVGKYGYMAPEQARHKPIDGRADLYSLGVMLFEVFTGDRLVDEQDQATLWSRVLNPTHRPPSSVVPAIPEEIDNLVMRAVAVKPEERFSSAIAMREFIDSMDTKASRTKELLEYLRYLYPHVNFSPPPVPDFSALEAQDEEVSMVIALSEDGARSVFGRGVLPVSFTQQIDVSELLPELERRHQQRLDAERRHGSDFEYDGDGLTVHDAIPGLFDPLMDATQQDLDLGISEPAMPEPAVATQVDAPPLGDDEATVMAPMQLPERVTDPAPVERVSGPPEVVPSESPPPRIIKELHKGQRIPGEEPRPERRPPKEVPPPIEEPLPVVEPEHTPSWVVLTLAIFGIALGILFAVAVVAFRG